MTDGRFCRSQRPAADHKVAEGLGALRVRLNA